MSARPVEKIERARQRIDRRDYFLDIVQRQLLLAAEGVDRQPGLPPGDDQISPDSDSLGLASGYDRVLRTQENSQITGRRKTWDYRTVTVVSHGSGSELARGVRPPPSKPERGCLPIPLPHSNLRKTTCHSGVGPTRARANLPAKQRRVTPPLKLVL